MLKQYDDLEKRIQKVKARFTAHRCLFFGVGESQFFCKKGFKILFSWKA